VSRTVLEDLIAPGRAAVVLQECQRGVIGDLSFLPALAQPRVVDNIATLATAARQAGVQVVHCIAQQRGDFKGTNTNAPLFAGARKRGICMEPGSPHTQVVPEIGVEADDLVLTRLHGLGPMSGTDLDPILRNLGVTTIIGAGVSVNVAVLNLVMDAVNAGYQVVLPRDAVAGFPADYASAVIDNTLVLLSTVVTTDQILRAWGR
jgi:nicotinamidase-related amidase